jgi:hypothetical protein
VVAGVLEVAGPPAARHLEQIFDEPGGECRRSAFHLCVAVQVAVIGVRVTMLALEEVE